MSFEALGVDNLLHRTGFFDNPEEEVANSLASVASANSVEIPSSSISSGEMTGDLFITKGFIRSKDYVSGSAGWTIDDDGTAEFSDVTVRGTIYATLGEIGGWTIASDKLSSGSGASYIGLISGTGIQLGNETFGSAPFSVTNTGVLVATNATITGSITATTGTIGGFTIGATTMYGGIIKTAATVGAGSTGVIMDTDGLRGYDSILGNIFNLPTDGSAPTFSSGIINETIFEISTNSILRTSATVGDGSASSAGVLINNTGFYICEANQLVANANIKALISGAVSIKGAITISSGSGIANLSDAGDLATTNEADANVLNMTNAPAVAGATDDTAADAAQTTADARITTFFQAGVPISLAAGDLWVDTDDKNKIYRATGIGDDQIIAGEWVIARDTDIATAIANAATAQNTADGKIVTFYQASVPTATDAGDLWVDTDDGNKMYRSTNAGDDQIIAGEWVKIQDTAIAAAQADATQAISDAAGAQGTADGKVTTFYQTTAPTAEGVGDLWVDTNDGNKLYRYSGAAWVEIQDDDIATAITNASTAQTTADGKIVTFIQTTAPTAEGVGDFWIDSDDDNKPHRWNGSAWISIENPTEWANVGDNASTKPADSADVTPQLPSDENLVGYWSLDDGTGSVVRDSGSGGNNGVITGATFVSGKSGKALDFSNLTTDKVEISNLLSTFAQLGTYSVSCWVYQDATGTNRNVWNFNGGSSNRHNLNISSSTIGFQRYDGSHYTGKKGTYPGIGGWHHIVCINNAGVLSLYVDTIEFIPAGSIYAVGQIGDVFVIGYPNSTTNDSGSIDGKVDEVRIYNTALTAPEAKALYLNPSGTKSALGLADAPGATVGADWSSNLINIPGTLATPSGAGLYLSATNLGYYDSSIWKTYMDSSGNFYLGGTSGKLQWNAGTDILTIQGTITIDNPGDIDQTALANSAASGATVGATWGTNVSNEPANLGDVNATEGTKLTGIATGADVTLSAINGGLAVTGGGITLDAGGSIKGGQTDYATGTGFFLGYSSGYKFSIGSPTNYIRWDGSYLTLKGSFDIGSTGVLNNSSYTVANLPIPPTTVGFNSPSAYE